MDLFSLKNKKALILGGTGVLGAGIALGMAQAGAAVAVSGRTAQKAEALAARLRETGARAEGYAADALCRDSLTRLAEQFAGDFGGPPDILVSMVGGNRKDATCTPDISFFDLPPEALSGVVELNFLGGAVLPAQIFGKAMCESESGGVILNISSMNAFRPLTNIPGYSAAKAAVSNFTQWLAVDLARRYGEKIRVNAVAPGFFLTDQNRFLLTDEKTGVLTERGRAILVHTPMGRFGVPEDLVGAAVWLAGDASRFVTGVVVPVDGGFSAFSGV